MYGSYLPSQMGYRQAGIPRRRETDNYYVVSPRGRKTRKNVRKAPIDTAVRVWYDCQCGRQTRNETGKCDHPGVTYLGLDNIGKDHL